MFFSSRVVLVSIPPTTSHGRRKTLLVMPRATTMPFSLPPSFLLCFLRLPAATNKIPTATTGANPRRSLHSSALPDMRGRHRSLAARPLLQGPRRRHHRHRPRDDQLLRGHHGGQDGESHREHRGGSNYPVRRRLPGTVLRAISITVATKQKMSLFRGDFSWAWSTSSFLQLLPLLLSGIVFFSWTV